MRQPVSEATPRVDIGSLVRAASRVSPRSAIGQPVRVLLLDEQSARGLRTAISRAASSRGMTVETVEGDGFAALRKVDAPRARKPTQQSAEPGKRRGWPRKRQDHDAAEIRSL